MTMKDVNVFIFFASSFTSDDNRYNKWRYILKRLSDCPFKNNFPFYITKSEHDSYNYQFKLTANHYMISASVMKKDFSNCFTRCLLSVSDDIFCVNQLNWKNIMKMNTYRRDEKLILITPLSSLIGVSIIQRIWLSQEN